MNKKPKTIKLWNGRGMSGKGHLYIGAYSRADACRMLTEIYHFNVSQWNREITIYFSEGCWGNSMEGIAVERGIWTQDDKFGSVPVKVYPK